MKKVLSFGEILIRQQALGSSFFEDQQNVLRVYPGGSEANVAATLAQMRTPTTYFSAFPPHILSEEIVGLLQRIGVDTSKVLWQGDRMGAYILLSADGLSKGEVIYDRKYSSFSQLNAHDIDFDVLFDDVDWLHWTALTPALNAGMAQLMKTVLVEAHQRQLTISVDLNYRSRLWQYGSAPIDIMPDLVDYCDVIMGNIWAANTMLGIPVKENLDRNTDPEVYFEEATTSAKGIFERFEKAKHIAYTFRFIDHPKHNLFYGTYHSKSGNTISAIHETNTVVDRIGSGDAFMAGFIHALRQTTDPQEIIDIATGAGYEKLFVEGDFGNGKY